MATITDNALTTVTTANRARPLAWLPKRWYVHVFLWFSSFMLALPLIYAMLISTQNNADVATFRLIPGNALPDNLTVVLNRNLPQFMVNSIGVAIAITVAKTILSLLAGLAFVYFRFPGKWIVFGFVLITLMMPTEVLILALLRFVSDLGWGNTYLALVVPFMASATGTFLFRQHFANIPAELSEAAQLDGTTPLQFLYQVLIPLSWNTIGALAVIQFIYAWNMYLWPLLVISDQQRQVVQVGLQTLVGLGSAISFGPLMLGAVIASIPPVIVFVLLQRQFMSGFALTRDK